MADENEQSSPQGARSGQATGIPADKGTGNPARALSQDAAARAREFSEYQPGEGYSRGTAGRSDLNQHDSGRTGGYQGTYTGGHHGGEAFPHYGPSSYGPGQARMPAADRESGGESMLGAATGNPVSEGTQAGGGPDWGRRGGLEGEGGVARNPDAPPRGGSSE
jgi:hypothetical protein